jgi:hypothetical protein
MLKYSLENFLQTLNSKKFLGTRFPGSDTFSTSGGYPWQRTVCASVGGANNNKLSLVGMQLPEKYKEKFDVSSEGPYKYMNKRYRREVYEICI